MNQVVGNTTKRALLTEYISDGRTRPVAYYCPNRRLTGLENSSLPRARSAVKGGGIRHEREKAQRRSLLRNGAFNGANGCQAPRAREVIKGTAGAISNRGRLNLLRTSSRKGRAPVCTLVLT